MLKLWSLITKKGSTTPTLLLFVASFLLTFSLNASAGTVKLAWHGNDEADGYQIRYGEESGNYTNTIDTGGETETVGDKIAYTIQNLQPGTYYFAIQSYEESHVTYSTYSEEIIITIPPKGSNPSEANDAMEAPNGVNSYAEASSGEVSLQPQAPGEVSLQPQAPEANSQIEGAFAAQAPIIELGEADIDHNWARVDFNEAFSDPIVVAKPLSYNDEEPATVAIRNVDSSGFEIRVQKWADLDDEHTGEHTLEKVGYLAMERGTYVLPDGTRLEADQQEAEAGSTLTDVAFLQEYQEKPVVIASITANDGEAPLISRLQGIDTEGFQVLFQDEETHHLQELNSNQTFSYIAWEPSSGVTGGVAFEVNQIDIVGNDSHRIDYQQQPLDSPIFLADIQTVNNEETANLRWRNKEASSVEAILEKVRYHDGEDEVEYAPENVGYVVFGIVNNK